MKNNGDIIPFLKGKDYVMVNNNLGQGSFGKTVLLKDPYIDELFVAKKYEPEYESIKERFFKNFLDEIKIMYKINHRNIVRIYNYYAYEDNYIGYIIMEHINGCSIAEWIDDCAMGLTFSSIDDIFTQLIDAFAYLEKNHIIHRDIRETNILVDEHEAVKVIDFGIGKIFDSTKDVTDSICREINRAASDTLPQEYYDGVYTSKTDMFYLAELINRLIRESTKASDLQFSYQHIIDKMMSKQPEDRFESFAEIKNNIEKHNFVKLNISAEDKRIYQAFANSIYNSLSGFIDEQKFITDSQLVITKIDKVMINNLFEDIIVDNAALISCFVSSGYKYRPIQINCDTVKEFLEWFKQSDAKTQELILSNIISKLSTIQVVQSEPDYPF